MEQRKKASASYALRHGTTEDLAAANTQTTGWFGRATTSIFGGLGGHAGATTGELDAMNVDGTLRSRVAQRNARNIDEELLHGSMRGDLRKVRMAIEANADPVYKNTRGVTPLMLASSSYGKEALEVMKEIHSKSVDLAMRDNGEWTALHHACRNGKTEAAKWLISVQCDPAMETADKKTTLMLATIEGKTDLVRELMKLKPVKAQVGARDLLSQTSLHFAVKTGAHEICKMLLESTAKVNAEDVDGKTPIMWACEHGRMDCVKTLAKKSAEIDAKDKSQRTPLLYACLNSYEGVALWLLKKSADPYFRDVQQDCPLSVAEDMGLSEVKRTVKMRRLELEEHED